MFNMIKIYINIIIKYTGHSVSAEFSIDLVG